MSKKNITVRLSPAAEKAISAEKNKSAAISKAVECWATCERQAMLSLKGKFTSAELSAFIDVLNGTSIPASQASALRFEFEDACHLDGLEQKWSIKKPATLAIFDTLSPAEWIVLVDFCRSFWSNPEQNLAEFVKTLAKKTFRVREKEAGNPIEEFFTFVEAENAIKKYEKDDKEEGNYTPNFYEIAEFNPETENWEVVS